VARSCSVCVHPAREEIDHAIARGESNRAISRQHAGLSKDAILRHGDSHLPAAVVTIATEGTTHHGKSVLAQLDDLVQETREILADAKGSGRRVAGRFLH
jgi:hypothetical protein